MSACFETRHWCGKSTCATNADYLLDSELFCNAPHPDMVCDPETELETPRARCRKLPGHVGPHSASLPQRPPRMSEWGAA